MKVLRLEKKNDGVMDDNSGDDDIREVRWSWRSDKAEKRQIKTWLTKWTGFLQVFY